MKIVSDLFSVFFRKKTKNKKAILCGNHVHYISPLFIFGAIMSKTIKQWRNKGEKETKLKRPNASLKGNSISLINLVTIIAKVKVLHQGNLKVIQ